MKSVLLVEDLRETAHWLADTVREAFPGAEVRCAPDRRSGLHAVRGAPVDLALIDLGLPDGRGVDVVAELRRCQPDALCVVVTVMGDDGSLLEALSAGAGGYLLKDTPRPRFVQQLRQLDEGVPALSPSIARRIMSHFGATASDPETQAALTDRETEVLALIGRGARNAEAAAALGLSPNTVASHIKSIYSKLGIASRAEAALEAGRRGLASPTPSGSEDGS